MKENKCPICGKNDIPDFLSQDVVCPCCSSDLSIYRLVNKIETESQSQAKIKSKSVKPLTYALLIFTTISLLLSGGLVVRVSNYKDKWEESSEAYKALATENQKLKESVSQISLPTQQSQESYTFKYIVRQGDSFWAISKKLYGTGTHYREIAEANNLEVTAVLNVGDELIIK